MVIHPTLNAANGNVGINTGPTPGNTLEINSSVTDWAGLRFSTLNSGSLSSTGNGKVLTVDGNGDVILVNDDVGTGGGSGASVCSGGTPSNYLVKYTSSAAACSSAVWEDPATKYVGIGTTSPVANLQSVLNANGSNLNTGIFDCYNTGSSASSAVGLFGKARSNTNNSTTAIYGVSG